MNPLLPIEYLVLVSAALLVAGGLCAWRSAERCPPRVRWAIVVLRIAALAVLVLIAANPGRWQTAERERTREWAVLLDSSQSMGTPDVKGRSRWSEACRLTEKLLAAHPSPELRLFTFASRLNAVASAPELAGVKSDGTTTDILGAGQDLLALGQTGDRHLAGIILLSDGRHVAAFRQYDLVVFGKGVEYFLTPERIRSLVQYVRDYGGSVIFARGKPYSGQMPEFASLEPVEWGPEWEGDFWWQPTAAGVDCGLFADTLPGAGDPVWQRLPALTRASQCLRTRAFTQVLAEGVSGAGENTHRFPAVLSQRFGKGLMVVVNSDGLWQWNFFPSFEGASRIYRNYWAQLMRWMITYADFLPGQNYALRLSDAEVGVDQPVIARVACRASPATPPRPVIRVLDGATALQEVVPSAAPGTPDQWEGIFSVRKPGTHRVELSVAEEGAPRPSVRLYETLHVRAPPTEKDDLSVDTAFLEKLASQSGGRVIDEAALGTLFDAPSAPVSALGENAQWKPRWDHGLILGGCLLLLAGEWYLRRRNGLV